MTVTFEQAPSQREILSFWQRGKLKEDKEIHFDCILSLL